MMAKWWRESETFTGDENNTMSLRSWFRTRVSTLEYRKKKWQKRIGTNGWRIFNDIVVSYYNSKPRIIPIKKGSQFSSSIVRTRTETYSNNYLITKLIPFSCFKFFSYSLVFLFAFLLLLLLFLLLFLLVESRVMLGTRKTSRAPSKALEPCWEKFLFVHLVYGLSQPPGIHLLSGRSENFFPTLFPLFPRILSSCFYFASMYLCY